MVILSGQIPYSKNRNLLDNPSIGLRKRNMSHYSLRDRVDSDPILNAFQQQQPTTVADVRFTTQNLRYLLFKIKSA